jgi:hypothetical protein
MRFVHILLLCLMAIATSGAAPILTLDPSSGTIVGAPGGEAGWGFSLTSDDDEWITVIASFLTDESDPALGFYQDFIGAQTGPSNGPLEPGSPAWVQSYDPINGTGVGTYFLSPLALLGSFNNATLVILYERYSANPFECDDCYLGEGELTASVSIQVADTQPEPIPEPSTLLLMAGGLAALALVRHRLAR